MLNYLASNIKNAQKMLFFRLSNTCFSQKYPIDRNDVFFHHYLVKNDKGMRKKEASERYRKMTFPALA